LASAIIFRCVNSLLF